MLDLRHPDGYAVTDSFAERWLNIQARRVTAYADLGDLDGARREAKYLYEALEYQRIPESAYFNGAHR